MELKTCPRPQEAVPAGGAGGRATVVIADAGTAAKVIVVETALPLSLGARFFHCGIQWRVVGRRRDSRVLVAQPDNG
jgi:hypothetical protein